MRPTGTMDLSRFLIEQQKRAARPNTWRRDLWIQWSQLDWFEQLTMGTTMGVSVGMLLWSVLR